MHYTPKKMRSFVNWAEKYELDEQCDEVRVLMFIDDFKTVAEKIIARVHWSLVFGILKCQHPVPDPVVRLEAINREMQSPAEVLFPVRYAQGEDLWVSSTG